MCPFFPENSSKMTRGSHQMAGLIVLYSIKMRVSLECGSLSRASFFGGFTVFSCKFLFSVLYFGLNLKLERDSAN